MADYNLHTLREKSFYIFLFPFEETCPTLAFKQIQLLPNCALLCSTGLEKNNTCCIKLLHTSRNNGFYLILLSLFFYFRHFAWSPDGSKNISFNDTRRLVQFLYLLRGTSSVPCVFISPPINILTMSSCSQSSSIVSSLPSNILLKKQSK